VQPYVIRQGDFLAKIAHQFDFDPDAVWNDSSNDDLRALRPNPNILLPGDLLYIPDQVDKQPVVHNLTTGATNTFISPSPPTIAVSHVLVGADPSTYASKAYTIKELDQLTGLETDGDGRVKFEAPVTLHAATVVFTDTGESWVFTLGGLNPINSLSGRFQRLQNLGYIASDIQYDADTPGNNYGVIRQGLRTLKADQAGGASRATDPPASSGGPQPSGSGSGADPSSSTTGSSSPGTGPTDPTYDSAGLNGDGTLDGDAQDALFKAYGS
jgi:hypothetical protein